VKQCLIATILAAGAFAQATPPSLTVNPAVLTFQYQIGATTLPASQNVQITSQPTGLNFTVAVSGSPFNAAWLLVSASAGKTPLTLKVQVNPTGLPAGAYSATVTVTGTSGSPPPQKAVAVTLQVGAAAPTITASPTALNFTYTTGQTAPSPLPFVLSSSGSPLSATITISGGTWLTVNPTGNISLIGLFNTITVTVDPTGLAPKVYTATVKISAPASANKTVNVPITLTVNAALPKVLSTWPAGVIEGSAQTVVTLIGSAFFSTSTVAVTGFTSAATVTVTDSASVTATETISVPVYSSTAAGLRINLASPLPSGTVGASYSQTLAVSGGTTPYTWSVVWGSLPSGLSISGSTLSGTPSASGTYYFALSVTDSGTPSTQYAYQFFKMTIDPAGSTTLRITVAAAPLPAGTVGSAYGAVSLTAAGGTGPYTWTATNLPPGLALTTAGSLSGNPTSVGVTGNLTATPVSDTAVLVTVPATYLATQGVVRMAVTTPSPGGGTSNEAQFQVYGPGPQIAAVLSSASFLQGTTSPGEIVTIFGLGLGPANLTLFDPSTPPIPTALPATAPSTTVTVNGTPAPLLYTSATQIACIVPYSVTGTTAQFAVSYGGVSSQAFTVTLAPTNPGIYTVAASGQGQGAILNYNATTNDYTINSSNTAAAKGSTVVMYLTGAGAMTSSVSNQLIPASPPVTPVQTPTVQIGGQGATVLAAQAPPGSVPGLLQLNVQVPSTVTSGNAVPVLISVGGVSTQTGVTMAIR